MTMTVTMPTPTITADTHRYEYEAEEIEVLLERFREERDGLIAEATITSARAPLPGLLYRGKINLSSPVGQLTIVRGLERRLKDVDFQGILQQVADKSLSEWREGEPSVILADQAVEPVRYLLRPFIQEGAVNVLYGDGETAKSLFSLALGISVATGYPILGFKPRRACSVLYLDWEDDSATHRERMEAICAIAGVEIPRNLYYRRMQASLSEAATAIRKDIGLHQVGLTIIDSIGLAGGHKPEEAGTKIELFGSGRSLRTTFFGIDHVSKADPHRAYGSVYTRNIARLMWEVQKAQSEASASLTMAFRNEKINRGMRHKRVGYRVDYLNEARIDETGERYEALVGVRFTGNVDISATDLVTSLDAIDQIVAYLTRVGISRPHEIAQGTGLKESTVRTTLVRWKGKKVSQLGDGWGALTVGSLSQP